MKNQYTVSGFKSSEMSSMQQQLNQISNQQQQQQLIEDQQSLMQAVNMGQVNKQTRSRFFKGRIKFRW